jgi:hypothetical protein
VNLTVLKRSRRQPQAADIFTIRPGNGPYLYGRVISRNTVMGSVKGWPLIYIYAAPSERKHAIPELRRDQLLIPPVITNLRPWTMGYFEQLENRPIGPQDRLPQHSFRDIRGWYVDERGKRLDQPAEPEGTWGLSSFRTIDDDVSKALGIPLSPVENV